MRIGSREFKEENHTYIMGILNVTPDSFSDGGKWNDPGRALARAEQMIEEGADIIDIGGESTRPGYTIVPDEEEIARVVPAIEKIKEKFDIPVSIDTYKSRVAKAALDAGADMVNDIWGLRYDSELADVAAAADVPCCLMHNRIRAVYADFRRELTDDLKESIRIAREAGIRDENIILDPGIGFGKTYEQNLQAMRCLRDLQHLGYPVLLGTSRKSVIGRTLGLPVDQRVEGTLATTVLGVVNQVMFVRVHDVKENARAIRMTEAVLYG